MRRTISLLLAILALLPAAAWPSSTDFDGANTHCNITSSAPIETAALSIAYWFRRETAGESNGMVFSKHHSGGTHNGWFVRTSSTTGYFFSAEHTTTDGLWTASESTTNAWVHFVWTYDSANNANDPLLYVNGASSTVSDSITPSGTFVNTFRLAIGGDTTSNVSDGQIADVALYNRVLDATEARSLYARGPQCVKNGRQGHWPLGNHECRNFTGTAGLDGTFTQGTGGLSTQSPPASYVIGGFCE